MAKTKSTKKQYRVLIACRNNDNGRQYVPGEIVTADDFPLEVIQDWLLIDPPVLEVV